MTCRDLLFGAYVVLCAAALTYPLFDLLGNRIDPRWLGVPFTLVWVVGWVLSTFVALVIYHATGDPEA